MRRILLIILFATLVISGKCITSPLEHQVEEDESNNKNVVGVPLQSNEQKQSILNTETKKKNGYLRSLYGNYYWNRNRYNNNNNYNNNYNNNRGSTFVQAIANFFLVIILLALGFFIWTFCGCTALCCGATGAASAYSYNNYYNDYFNASAPQVPGTMQQNYNSGNNNLRNFGNETNTTSYGKNSHQSFSQTVQQVKRDVENTMVTLNQSKLQPFSGKYNASYLDSQSNIKNSTVCLFFTSDPQRQGFTITGEGNDNNGYSVVEEGFAKYDGSCWWIEKKISGNAGGTQFLSRGKFDFGQKTFEGTWIESTSQSGQYLSFTAV